MRRNCEENYSDQKRKEERRACGRYAVSTKEGLEQAGKVPSVVEKKWKTKKLTWAFQLVFELGLLEVCELEAKTKLQIPSDDPVLLK